MSTRTDVVMLPRELVLASAGTGKTFRISSRIIGLLAAGVRPEAIFASTFTRKAAGEILDRVLARLAEAALDVKAAETLSGFATLPGAPPLRRSCDEWLVLLRDVVSELHRLNISTLDSFFVRAVSSFADDVALPQGWTIADTPTAERVRAEALHQILDTADVAELIELVRGLEAEDAARSVHDALLRRAEELLSLHYALDPAADDAWDGFAAAAARTPKLDVERRRYELADAIEIAPVGQTKTGKPDGRWHAPVRKLADLVRAGDWKAMLETGLCTNVQRGDRTFYGGEVPEELCALIEEACQLARCVLAPKLAMQGRAMGRLAQRLAEAVEAKQRELGAYGFSDLTRLLGGPDALCGREDLFYRLDARTEHILLDEFQDTALAQWEALEPLVSELLQSQEGERAAVVVADPKQSIYAWRGGEPLLVEEVGKRYLLEPDTLSMSYRSSQTVLDVVNTIFSAIDENEVFTDDGNARSVAADWKKAFARHGAAKTHLPGYVELRVGPEEEASGEDRPLLCREAAKLVERLRMENPGASVGVLTRKNKTVARIMLELRDLGIHASEEGGNPLTDSRAVSAIVSLLRLADHPGDRVARYHVAMTPLGPLVRFSDYTDTAAACRLAHELRRELLEHGYGRTLDRIGGALAERCEPRDRRRLAQLAELGFRYDARATLRVGDFVRLVEAERVEDPTAADVRVMTVHQSKGLEFDIVVLPELDVKLVRSDPSALAYRPGTPGRPTRVFPYVGEAERALFSGMTELSEAADQASAGRWRDALSGLYVALTRARHAMHILVKPDGKKISEAKSAARLVRCALGVDQAVVKAEPGAVLYTLGDPAWFSKLAEANRPRPTAPTAPVAAPGVELRAGSHSGKSLGQVKPSDLAGGTKVDVHSLLRLDMHAAEQGTLAHAWFEQIGWLEDGLPTDEELLTVARRLAPSLPSEPLQALLQRFHRWLTVPQIRQLLSRASYPAGATVEREVPFIHRSGGRLVEGVIDRLVLLREDERVVGAEILDYKTDAMPSGDRAAVEQKLAYYRPQLAAYRDGVAAGFRLPPERVAARLVFLEVGMVV
jgi:ATP-dependent helicase/nuclease subunit A